ncbi:MAG: sulfatase-like hydrolase/transferase [Clostridiales bacterium]|nr:sulfatase-like hydrolase/transferase [Clostridiales bacterium]
MKKNLVIITPDQMRADILGCYGNTQIGSTHIDRLAALGTTFDQCYCAAPLCGPSRISFATSTYFSEHNHRNYGSTVSPDVPNLPQCLHHNGYTTGMFGKNHLFTYSRLPEVWDELDEICLGNYDGHTDYKHSFSAFTLAAEHPYNITGRLTDEAIDFVNRRKDSPFLLWVNYQDPHPAFTCPAPYDTMFDPDEVELPKRKYSGSPEPDRNKVWRVHSEADTCTEAEMRQAIAHYMGQVRYVDDSVGRIMQSLEDNGLMDNTVVLFFSDHGELLGDYGMFHKLPVFYDSLTHIPAILYAPGVTHAGDRFTGLVEEVDLAPTLLKILDLPVPPTMCGKALDKALAERDYTGRANVLCEAGGGAPTWHKPDESLKIVAPFEPTSFGPGAMLRTDKYMISVYGDDNCELFDLEKDPLECHNVWDDPAYSAVRSELTEKLFKRVLSVKVRDTGRMRWDKDAYPVDVRFEPLD